MKRNAGWGPSHGRNGGVGKKIPYMLCLMFVLCSKGNTFKLLIIEQIIDAIYMKKDWGFSNKSVI